MSIKPAGGPEHGATCRPVFDR